MHVGIRGWRGVQPLSRRLLYDRCIKTPCRAWCWAGVDGAAQRSTREMHARCTLCARPILPGGAAVFLPGCRCCFPYHQLAAAAPPVAQPPAAGANGADAATANGNGKDKDAGPTAAEVGGGGATTVSYPSGLSVVKPSAGATAAAAATAASPTKHGQVGGRQGPLAEGRRAVRDHTYIGCVGALALVVYWCHADEVACTIGATRVVPGCGPASSTLLCGDGWGVDTSPESQSCLCCAALTACTLQLLCTGRRLVVGPRQGATTTTTMRTKAAAAGGMVTPGAFRLGTAAWRSCSAG